MFLGENTVTNPRVPSPLLDLPEYINIPVCEDVEMKIYHECDIYDCVTCSQCC